jgi:hypothetical protein
VLDEVADLDQVRRSSQRDLRPRLLGLLARLQLRPQLAPRLVGQQAGDAVAGVVGDFLELRIGALVASRT